MMSIIPASTLCFIQKNKEDNLTNKNELESFEADT